MELIVSNLLALLLKLDFVIPGYGLSMTLHERKERPSRLEFYSFKQTEYENTVL